MNWRFGAFRRRRFCPVPVRDTDDRPRAGHEFARVEALLDIPRQIRHLAVFAVVNPSPVFVLMVARPCIAHARHGEAEFPAAPQDSLRDITLIDHYSIIGAVIFATDLPGFLAIDPTSGRLIRYNRRGAFQMMTKRGRR